MAFPRALQTDTGLRKKAMAGRSAQEFDYIVVGAGSAGCVLAGRLSANPRNRVLLIEAGGWDWHPLIRVPLGVGRIWGFDRFDWG